MDASQVIIRPVVSEKSYVLAGYGGAAAHTVLPSPVDDTVHVAMSTGGVYRSDDGGRSWHDQQRIYGGGPMWEPVAVQRPDSGQIQLFFANETPYTQSHDQEITMLITPDDVRAIAEL